MGKDDKAPAEFKVSESQRWWTDKTTAVVTGGNKGIGWDICRILSAQGIKTVLAARDGKPETLCAGLALLEAQLLYLPPGSWKQSLLRALLAGCILPEMRQEHMHILCPVPALGESDILKLNAIQCTQSFLSLV